jgi:hypothetical protein
MGLQKKTRRFTQVKRIIGQRDARLKKNQEKGEIEAKKKAKGDEVIREVYAHDSPIPFTDYKTDYSAVRKSVHRCSSPIIPPYSLHFLSSLTPTLFP